MMPNQLDLVCRDLAKTVAFYRLLGVKIPKSAGPPHVRIDFPNGLELAFDTEKLARAYNKGYRRSTGGSNIVIGFSVKTRRAVDALHAKMTKAGYKSLQPPWDAFWGSRYAIVADPDGNPIGMMSPPDPKKRWQLDL